MKMQLPALIVFTFLLAGTAFGQKPVHGDIPSVIQNNFSSAYPQSTDVEWKLDNGLYRVEFETGQDLDHKIWYNGASIIVREEVEITEQDLPDAVRSAIKAKFSGYEVDEADKITTPAGVTYEVELDAFLKKEWEVVFSSEGTILSKIED